MLAVSEEEETLLPSFSVQCIIKQLLDSVFGLCDMNNHDQGLGKGYQPRPGAESGSRVEWGFVWGLVGVFVRVVLRTSRNVTGKK